MEDIISISVNFDYDFVKTDFIFVSNLRRFRKLEPDKLGRCIATSNIPASGAYLQISYYDLQNDIEAIRDNAGIMAVKFLIEMNVGKIVLAGFDGYSHDPQENYASSDITITTKRTMLDQMNREMTFVMKQLAKEKSIEFLTTPKFIKL